MDIIQSLLFVIPLSNTFEINNPLNPLKTESHFNADPSFPYGFSSLLVD